MPYLALDPVSAAIYTRLNVAALTALAPGGVMDDIAQGSAYPLVFYEVHEVAQIGGLGSQPGVRALPELELRVHVYSQAAGMTEAQTVMAKVIELLFASALVVTGYATCALFLGSTIPLPDELVAGVKVRELVSIFRLYVQEA